MVAAPLCRRGPTTARITAQRLGPSPGESLAQPFRHAIEAGPGAAAGGSPRNMGASRWSAPRSLLHMRYVTHGSMASATPDGVAGELTQSCHPQPCRLHLPCAACSNVTSAGASRSTRDKGWAGYHRDDPEGIDEPRVALFCPPCAAAMHGLLPEIAATYVRADDLRELVPGALQLEEQRVPRGVARPTATPRRLRSCASFAAPAHQSH